MVRVTLSRAIVFLVVLCAPVSAVAVDQGQFTDVPEPIRNWFKNMKAPGGGFCCDIADGHRVQYDMRDDGYWALIEGEWFPVPPHSVIRNSKNPTGDGVVWYNWYIENGRVRRPFIRCFVPAGDV